MRSYSALETDRLFGFIQVEKISWQNDPVFVHRDCLAPLLQLAAEAHVLVEREAQGSDWFSYYWQSGWSIFLPRK